MTRNTTTGFLVFGLIAFAIMLLAVLLSSAMEAGGWMFIGFIIGLVVVVGLILWAGAFIVRQYVAVRDKRDTFILEMSKLGYTHPGSGWISNSHQIAAPQAEQKRVKVFDFNPNDIHTAAVNYILYSRNLLGDSGNRLASAPECAGAGNIENYSARSWERIVTHLSNCYGISRQPGPIANGGGVYVPAEIGTVGNLYNKVLLNSAVEALPGVTR